MSVASEIEAQIGVPPGHTITVDTHAKRVALRAWLVAQGIDPRRAAKAQDNTLCAAYGNANYLSKMLFNSGARRNDYARNIDVATLDDTPEPDHVKYNGGATRHIFDDEPEPAQASQAPVTTDAIAKAADAIIAPRIESALRALERGLEERVRNAKLTLSDDAKATIRTLAQDTARVAFEAWLPPRRLEIVPAPDAAPVDLGVQHFKFEVLLRACAARDHRGQRLNIWLTGPTGSGKTSACESVAKALGLAFGSDGSLDADYKVMGFRDANGNIISSAFIDRYRDGGLYVADEIDNWLPSALLSLNAALANGWMSTPGGIIRRHKDFVCIACANTWGLGATNDYVGRSKLDAASLNRFLPKIDWPIDEKLETAIARNSGDIGITWCENVQRYRKRAREQGLHVIISPRDTFAGIALLAQGFDTFDVIDMTFAAGLKPEQRKALGIEERSDEL